VPVAVEAPAVRVSVEEPEPGAAIEVGLKAAVAPVGSPDAESEIALLKPPDTAVVTVVVPKEPCTAETDVGEAKIVKSGVAAAVTVNDTVVVWVVDPPVPVTVTV
jgi:hypothetical protein